jgi:preprotein translocase subunit SecG
METVIIVIHLMVIVALVAVVLLQRSEGGALGIGGGNAFMSSRGQGNVLTRATGILAAAFFATSIALTVISRLTAPPSSILDTVPATAAAPAPAGTIEGPASTNNSGGILDELNRFTNPSAAGTAPADGSTTTVPPAGGSTTTTPPAEGSTTTPPATTAPAEPQVPTSQ